MLQNIAAAVLVALASVPQVHAHGYVSAIIVDGKNNTGSNPNWYYQPKDAVVPTAGWYAMNQDNGYVSPAAFATDDITCHKAAKPGNQEITVAAGSNVTLQWNTWPDTHRGPILDYLASCAGSCTAANVSDLEFVKIHEGGLVDDTSPPGTWITDQLIADSFTWNVTIPTDIKPGFYVLRHEIIALHSANTPNGAQNYPQCINLVVTGEGTVDPCANGNCTKAPSMYKADDPGILVDIYTPMKGYEIPGPAVWSAEK